MSQHRHAATFAQELHVQVVETTKRMLEAEHSDMLISMVFLALTYMNQGR